MYGFVVFNLEIIESGRNLGTVAAVLLTDLWNSLILQTAQHNLLEITHPQLFTLKAVLKLTQLFVCLLKVPLACLVKFFQ